MKVKNIASTFITAGKHAWEWLRTVSGDDAYERYLAHRQRCPVEQDAAPLTRHEFFVREQARKWNGIRRCC